MLCRPLTILAIASTALMLAACGGSASSSATSPGAAAAQPASATHSAAAAPYAAGAYGARTTAAATPASDQVTVTAKHDRKLGVILAAGARDMTVYMFKADHGTHSNCSGACANVWPPVIGRPTATGTARAAELGTVLRSDGTRQVTYRGHPLYRYAKDGDAGDAYGAGITEFGAAWYALAPSGKVIDNS